MKKVIAWLMICLMLCSSVAMGEEMSMKGWTVPASGEMTEEMQQLFEKGVAELLGVSYTPKLLLATQTVNGTDHLGNPIVAGEIYCFLCLATVVYPDAEPYYTTVYIFENQEGQTEIWQIEQVWIGLRATEEPAEAELPAQAE